MKATDNEVRGARTSVTYVLALVGGAILFFLVFAAAFNGIRSLLILFLLSYAGAGALGVRRGGATPVPLAITLVAPAIPWVTWLFPASVPESGLWRALLWPGMVAIAFGLAWAGGAMSAWRRRGVRASLAAK
ncbi:MAG TPA: hypothetical protein VMY76_04855 [Gemmatimonadales bacterium]|nr:hypothetical protein [Gemmatimonadales bacterium]